jgi:DNA-binding LytR/AlgR family response regulator
MRIAICEDEQSMQKNIVDIIEDWANVRKVQIDILRFPSAEAFMMAWPEHSFDLAFLDIKMKGMSGLELAEYIRKSDEKMLIVFVTSFEQYSLEGYNVNAFQYLIKPMSPAKLMPILDKAYTIWRSHHQDVLLVSDGNGQIRLPFGDIYCITVLSRKANIQTKDAAYELQKTVEELSHILPKYFIRCHRSFIVNLYKVDCMYKSSLLMSNKKSLPISRNRSKEVNDAFIMLHTAR